MAGDIQPIVMPKWGLAMEEGVVTAWNVAEGATITKGQEIADIETSKIANVFESPVSGAVRRIVAQIGETLPVGALLAVVADKKVGDADIDAFVAKFDAALKAALAAKASEKKPEPETVEITGGRKIRYLKLGSADGPPIVFVHGFGGDLNNWLFNQEALAESHTTYAIDLPGHGGSTKDVGAGDLASMTAALAAWLDALKIARTHLVGHSMGGGVVLQLAATKPDMAASATLIAPAGLGPDIAMDFINGFIEASRGKKLEPVLQMIVANPELVTRDMIEDVLKFKRIDGVDAALKKLRDGLFPGGRQAASLRDSLAKLKPPVQVIVGAKDRIIPAAHAQGLPGNVKAHVIETAGHMPHMEAAAEVNRLIAAIAG
ncbi:MAG TPA: acetoin dehydrogenase dihydrolipoyllysine-residue acetyltransferase subunit [Methylomirabilota bacterium]|nr:acetoin dehydrogenase dihydrolipoyllysine-residue acetyltransferase subunit [Methylomirabilota bacterium]